MITSEPQVLKVWRENGLSTQDALDTFDGLAAIEVSDLIGRWRGHELPTGHPLDDVLEGAGWYGKVFESEDVVTPLLFGHKGDWLQVDPGKLPLRRMKRLSAIGRSRLAQSLFRKALPLLSTTHPAARLRKVEHRHVVSAAMIYDEQPIIDHFRRVDDEYVLGLMDVRYFEQPYFFLLQRADALS